MGLPLAQDMVLTSRGMGADDVLAVFLVARVVDDAELRHEGKRTFVSLRLRQLDLR